MGEAKMKRRSVLLMLVLLLILAVLFPSAAAAIIPGWGVHFTVGSKTYGVWDRGNWQYFSMDVAPCVKSGRVYVPVRYVAQAWNRWAALDYQGNSVIFYTSHTRPCDVAVMTVGSNILIVNGYTYRMDGAPFVKDGRIMVPVRWVAWILNVAVDWDPASRSVYVYEYVRILQ